MADEKADGPSARPATAAHGARAASYDLGVMMGCKWAQGRLGKRSALRYQTDNLKRFWRESTGQNMFWFQRARGWEYGDYLYVAMNPWDPNKRGSAAFWAGLDLESESKDCTFLTGFVDGALGVAELD